MTADKSDNPGLWYRLRRRGVVRVALSYLVIAWLVLQIGDVVLDPLGAPPWAMRTLIVLAAVGFPVALLLAWFLEFSPSGIEVDDLDERETRPTLRGLRHYADAVIIGGLLLVVAFLLVRQDGLVPGEVSPPVLAILPFDELDSSADNHFGDGFAETLIHKLGILDQLVVLASSSTFEFRGDDVDLPAAAVKLGAEVLLQGSMRRAGGLLRLDASLVDASTNQRLWAESYRRPIEDVFRVQDEIANAIATVLGVRLSASQVERIAKPPTTSLPAYDTFLRATRQALESRDPERMPEALQYLYDAIELDPEFALAHATLVEAMYLTKSYRHWETKWSDFAEEARAAADRAQALDPSLGEGYLAEALVAMEERDAGIAEHPDENLVSLLEKALELSPNNPLAMKFLSHFIDDTARSLDLLTRAALIDPRSGIIRVNIGERYARAGAYDQAEGWYLRAAQATEPYFRLGYKQAVEMNVWDAVRLDRAARLGRAFEATYPMDYASKLSYLRSLIELGAWDQANELLARTAELAAAGDAYMGWIHTHKGLWVAYVRGDNEQAIELAERYIRENLLTTPDWPDLSGQMPVMLRAFELLALADIQRSDVRSAIDRYDKAGLDPGSMGWWNWDGPAIPQAVMYAALQRHAGEPERADRLLRDILERMEGAPVRGQRGKGFAEFAAYAFLGDADAAIDALQRAIDEGWLPGWWGLEHGAFDENYAAVLRDPRFTRLYKEINSRVTAMRESFLESPDLPQDVLLEAGLAPTASGEITP